MSAKQWSNDTIVLDATLIRPLFSSSKAKIVSGYSAQLRKTISSAGVISTSSTAVGSHSKWKVSLAEPLTDVAMTGDSGIATVCLETISCARLWAQEPGETARLLKAAESPGFFYLDLKDGFASQMLADVQDLYPLAEQYFDQPHELKMEHFRKEQERGQAITIGMSKNSVPRTNEVSVSKDTRQARLTRLSRYASTRESSILGDLVLAQIARDEIRRGTLALPPIFEDNFKLFHRVSSIGYTVTQAIFTSLSSALKLSPANLWQNHHRDEEPSNTGLKLYYEPAKERAADVAENWRTDGGTLTLLFCDQWGLYMEEPTSKKGGFILPVPGCAVVNVADSLQRLSGGRLHSCRHQVIQPADGFRKRYFVVYFLRPELESS